MKQEMQTTTATDAAAVSNIRILLAQNCPKLSGGDSTLEYQVGCGNDLATYLRVTKNSSNGFFSNQWIALRDILEIMAGRESVGAAVLRPLYSNKSSNNQGFMMAVLCQVHIAEPCSSQQGSYRPLDASAFKSAVQALIDSDIGHLNIEPIVKQPVTRKKKGTQLATDASADATPEKQ